MNRVIQAEQLAPLSAVVAVIWLFGLLGLGLSSRRHHAEVARVAAIAAAEAQRLQEETARREAAARAEAARLAEAERQAAARRAAAAREAARIAALAPRSDEDVERLFSSVTVATLRPCTGDDGATWQLSVSVAQTGALERVDVVPASACIERIVRGLAFREARSASIHTHTYRVPPLPTLSNWEASAEDFE